MRPVLEILRLAKHPARVAPLAAVPYVLFAGLTGSMAVFMSLRWRWTSDYSRSPLIGPMVALSAAALLVALVLPHIVLRLPKRLDDDAKVLEAYCAALLVHVMLVSSMVPVWAWAAAWLAEDLCLLVGATLVGVIPAAVNWPTPGRRARWAEILRARGYLTAPSSSER